MDLIELPSVVDRIGYLPLSEIRPRYRIYQPSSGRPPENPPTEYHERPFYDCRRSSRELDLDRDGVALRPVTSPAEACYHEQTIRARYYPEVERLVAEATGAAGVVAFDHNVRSADGTRRQELGAQPPVDAAHGDYTADSGRRRVQQALTERGEPSPDGARTAVVNVWRPLVAVVQDRPLAVCDPRTVAAADLVETAIEHFGADLARPRHSGQIYSVRFNPAHRWLYLSDMRSDEAMLFKTFDSVDDGRPRFMIHAAFTNPACPPDFTPRDSIEVRTALVYP